MKRDTAVEHAKRGQGASEWIDKTIKKKFEELPPPKIPTLREKALASAAVRDESLTEVEILQKIIVRENLLSELQKLLQFQVDLDGIMSEVDELIRAIRFQTLEVIEEIATWKADTKAPRQFFYRGQNYLLKLLSDTAFLDEYDDLGDHYGFYFASNPLFYDGIIQGRESHNHSVLSTNTFNSNEIDGIQLFRLHDAELVLQREVELFQNKNSSELSGAAAPQSSVLNVGEANFSVAENSAAFNNSYIMPVQASSIISADNQQSFSHQRNSTEDKRRSPDGTLKPVKVMNDLKYYRILLYIITLCRIKRARIGELEEEIAEIQAMYAHVEDQMTTVNEAIEVLKQKVGIIERKKHDAIANGKTALAQKYMIEVSNQSYF